MNYLFFNENIKKLLVNVLILLDYFQVINIGFYWAADVARKYAMIWEANL